MIPLIALVLGTAAEPQVLPKESVEVGGTKRTFRLVVPATVDPKKKVPLLVAFHGMGIDSPELMPKYTKLDDLAAAEGWLLAYPAAEGRIWGITPDKVKADLAFYDALIENLGKRYTLDRDRLYLLGMSNGAYFAQAVAVERSGDVAGVVAHSGALGLQTALGINAKHKFPVFLVHGTNDKILGVDLARQARDKYRKEGHSVEYLEVPNLGHIWAVEAKVNDKIAKFIKDHPREARK